MNRRQILRAMALGGGIIAGELWIPGQKFISIVPARKSAISFWDPEGELLAELAFTGSMQCKNGMYGWHSDEKAYTLKQLDRSSNQPRQVINRVTARAPGLPGGERQIWESGKCGVWSTPRDYGDFSIILSSPLYFV